MDYTHHHEHLHHVPSPVISKNENMKLAISATLHCLLGCGIGEVVGMIIATYFGLSMTSSLVISIVLGFVFGFALGIVPLLKKGLPVTESLKILLVGEGL